MKANIGKSEIKNLSAILALVLSAALLNACNTVEGAGQDIEAAGDAIEDTAADAKD